jgi:hypothetical protein
MSDTDTTPTIIDLIHEIHPPARVLRTGDQILRDIWETVDPSHYGVCQTCQRLFPCGHVERARDEARQRHQAALRSPCVHCGKETAGGMTIAFGPRGARDVIFHGKRGPCENAAYQYAATFGYWLPPKDENRKYREWNIWGVKLGDLGRRGLMRWCQLAIWHQAMEKRVAC